MREFDQVPVGTDPTHRRQGDDHAIPTALLGRAASAGRADAAGVRGMLHLQRQVGNAGTAAMLEEERSPVHDVVASGGEALDRETRADMESTLGHDFSDVRIHRDAAAHQSAAAVQARAYTVGSHVVFQRDAYDPSSTTGRHTLAHELSHVVQQRSGPVDGTEAPGGIRVSDPSDRYEREASRIADQALARPAVAAGAAAVQRAEASEEEVQTYVQRAEAPEEEEVQTYVQRDEEPEEESE